MDVSDGRFFDAEITFFTGVTNSCAAQFRHERCRSNQYRGRSHEFAAAVTGCAVALRLTAARTRLCSSDRDGLTAFKPAMKCSSP
jgi:hypothetical protein